MTPTHISGVTYTVHCDDNFRYMDESERVTHGVFKTPNEAVAACRRIVDGFLAGAFKPGMSREALYGQYVSFGEDPFIVPVDPKAAPVMFSGWDYAKARCAEIASDLA